MPDKKHTVTVRLNELEYKFLNELKELREELQDHEVEYSLSDIMRIGLGYATDIELFGSKTTTFHKDIAEEQKQYCKEFWRNKDENNT